MCSRFELKAETADLLGHYQLRQPPPNHPEPERRPTDACLVVTPQGAGLLRFGLTVDWDKRPLINARAEGLADRPTFRPLLARRCLIPASAWIEWQPMTGGIRPRWRLRPDQAGLFSFAGLYGEDGFVIVTCAPSPSIAFVHDRMPVVLRHEDEATWLSPDTPFTEAVPLLKPYDGPLSAKPADPPPAQGSLF